MHPLKQLRKDETGEIKMLIRVSKIETGNRDRFKISMRIKWVKFKSQASCSSKGTLLREYLSFQKNKQTVYK